MCIYEIAKCINTFHFYSCLLTDVIHTQGPLDGSLYAKVRKKESFDGGVTTNGLPATVDHTLPAVDHTLPPVDHALSVSSDSGNSTASIKPIAQMKPASAGLGESAILPAPQPRGKQELDQFLSGLESPMHHTGYQSSSGSGGGGVLHLVPAQIHVNGHNNVRPWDRYPRWWPAQQPGREQCGQSRNPLVFWGQSHSSRSILPVRDCH